jgi:hypothetical protein
LDVIPPALEQPTMELVAVLTGENVEAQMLVVQE